MRGKYLGKFEADDRLIAFMRNGSYKITNYDLTNRYEPEKTLLLEKFNPSKPVSAVYVDGDSKQYMVKRFMIETSTADKEFGFISETIGSRLVVATTSETPEVEVEEVKGKDKGKTSEVINLEDIIDVKGWKALGNKLSQFKVTKVNLVQEEDAGPDESGGDDEVIEAAETEKGSQSPKKKEQQEQEWNDPNQWLEDGEQANLFEEAPKPNQQAQQKASQKPKVQAEQQSLFGESQQSQPKEKSEKTIKDEESKTSPESEKTNDFPKSGKDESGKEFGVGETIDLEL
jgi:topoisomerase-4 subunit A